MKNIFICLFILFGTSFVYAQKYAYIDSDYILSNVPEYKEAKDKLDKLADRWTKDIEERYAALKVKKDNFAREEVLLPTEEKQKRKDEILKVLSEEAKKFEKTIFQKNFDLVAHKQQKECLKTVSCKKLTE
jgi:outer membrane protein